MDEQKTHKGFDVLIAFKNEYGFTHKSEYYYDAEQIARWVSNDRPVPLDAAKAYHISIGDVEKHKAAIDKENAESIAAYRAHREQNGYDEEELHEMREAFGEGTDVVDVFTGKKIKL